MSDFINNLISMLEPTVLDLDDKIKELSKKQETLDEINKMLEYVGDDVSKVGEYSNQQIILDNLSKISSNETEYKASCYLLRSNEELVKLLPQYIESSNYIEKLITLFREWQKNLISDVEALEIECDDKRMNKKYLEVFNKENPFVRDVDEFSDFLKKREIVNKDKIDLLVYTINSNVSNYIQEERVKGR